MNDEPVARKRGRPKRQLPITEEELREKWRKSQATFRANHPDRVKESQQRYTATVRQVMNEYRNRTKEQQPP